MADVNLKISATDEASGPINKAASSLDGLKNAAQAAATALGAYAAAKFIESSTLMAARNETLGVVLHKVGENAGYTAAQMDGYAQAVAKMGITVESSRQGVTRMAQANLDLAKSSELARLSQDAAVIAGMNSSQAMDGILHGITTLQPEVLRTYGIVVNFEQAYMKAAATMGTSAEALTQNQKQQIALNTVLEQGKGIAGAYEASLGTVGKALYSLERYIKDNKAAFGEIFTPALKILVDAFTQSLKDLGAWFIANKGEIQQFARTLAEDVKIGVNLVKDGAKLLADHLDLVKGAATAAGIVLAGIATSSVIGSIGTLIGKFVELRAVILAASAANLTLAGTSVSTLGGAAAGLSRGGMAGLVVGTGIAAYMGTSALLKGMTGPESAYNFNDTMAERDRQATINLEAAMAKKRDREDEARSEAAAAAGKLAQAKRQAEEETFAREQQEKKLYEAKKTLADEYVKWEIQKEKEKADLVLDLIKNQFAQGKLAADDYYNAIRKNAADTANAEIGLLQTQFSRIQGDISGGKLTPEQRVKAAQDLVQIKEKESEITSKYQKTLQETDAAYIKDLKTIKDLLLENQATVLTGAGQYVEAVNKQIQKEKESIEYLKVKAAAEKGNQDAIGVIKAKDLAFNLQVFDATVKQTEAERILADAIFEAAQAQAKLSGADEEILKKEKDLYDSKRKLGTLQDQLNRATMAGNNAEISALNSKIGLINQENALKERSVQLSQEIAVLAGQIVGFSNGVPIYANGGGAFSNGSAVSLYQSAAGFLAGQRGQVVSGGGFGLPGFTDINGNVAKYAQGTNYVPQDGLAFLHEGEAVVPKKYNQGSGSMVVSIGDIIVQGGATGAETAKEIARAIFPEIQKLSGRRLATA